MKKVEIILLLADSARSRAYLQVLLYNGYIPAAVILLEKSEETKPGQIQNRNQFKDFYEYEGVSFNPNKKYEELLICSKALLSL